LQLWIGNPNWRIFEKKGGLSLAIGRPWFTQNQKGAGPSPYRQAAVAADTPVRRQTVTRKKALNRALLKKLPE